MPAEHSHYVRKRRISQTFLIPDEAGQNRLGFGSSLADYSSRNGQLGRTSDPQRSTLKDYEN